MFLHIVSSTEQLSAKIEEKNKHTHTDMEDSKYLPELLAEKDSLDSSFTHATKLISAGKVNTFTGVQRPPAS